MQPKSNLVRTLPEHLSERVRVVKDLPPVPSGSYVLYWMHHAVRGHENPALDVAVEMGNRLRVPVLVYQGLAGRHAYNSDRHHTFIMQGARDVQQELRSRGIAYRFYLSKRSSDRSPLIGLVQRAVLVVTEDFPAPPFPKWLDALEKRVKTPIWSVDAHCMVPMQSVSAFHDRAYKFRAATEHEFKARVGTPWTNVEPDIAAYEGSLEFQSVDFATADISDLCASCEIDHSVGPVQSTVGGSRAGYKRWDDFRNHGLESYARLRNDAAVPPPHGVSRLSPYLHHGHVSPFRIAREASLDGSAGSTKFLDELLIWRELAFNYCYHHRNPDTIDALPAWARETLQNHAIDERTATYSWETFARARTGDALWDLAQRSLLIHGELHNNVRMTWGKAILQWTSNPARALEILLDLNNRYALDGSDPNSYAGILWCMGLFDRPFKPEIPVFGLVRPRSTDNHAKRLDMNAYEKRITESAGHNKLSVAIIGAGVSGLVAGRTLLDHGHDVKLFDKARGPGGRMASRRNGEETFDHGAQYFTARDERFKQYVSSWIHDGLVQEWTGRVVSYQNQTWSTLSAEATRFVGVPRMSALTRHLSADLDIKTQTRVEKIVGQNGRWQLVDDSGSDLGQYDAVLVTTPPEQAASLLTEAPQLADAARTVNMLPCWALLVRFSDRIPIDGDGIFFNSDGPLSWAARNASKPGRVEAESWVVHASHSWSQQHLEDDKETVANILLESFFQLTGISPADTDFLQAHRWRYALAANPLRSGCLWDAEKKLGAGGDWCHGSRVEGAFLSGMALAGRVLGTEFNREEH